MEFVRSNKIEVRLLFLIAISILFSCVPPQKSKHVQIKQGYVEELLDSHLNKTHKIKNAVFKRFWYYDNGFPIGYPSKNPRNMRIEIVGAGVSDSISYLDGVYKFIDKKKRLVFEERYEKGKILYFKHYLKSGALFEHIDYSDKFNGQEGSCMMYLYKDTLPEKLIYKGYFGKFNGKWQDIRQSTGVNQLPKRSR